METDNPLINNTAAMIERLCALLPHVTECGESEYLARNTLYESMLRDFPDAPERAQGIVDICLLLLRFTGVLDKAMLEQGGICFVSYAARNFVLMALLSLARQDSIEAEGWLTSGFWRQANDLAIASKRREVLEKAAKILVSVPNAPAVRHIHVSFGLLRYGNHFLCHPRELRGEDKDRGKGDLTLPGGRVELCDFPAAIPRSERMRMLTSTDDLGECAKHIHLAALQRELAEEIGLEPGMYTAASPKIFTPYYGCYGGGDSYAPTITNIRLYPLVMAPSALNRIESFLGESYSDRWATAQELLNLRNKAGRKIFFDAGRQNLTLEWLESIPDSLSFLTGISDDSVSAIVYWSEEVPRIVLQKKRRADPRRRLCR